MNELSFVNPPVLGLFALPPVILAAWLWGVRRADRRVRLISRSKGSPPPYAAALLLSLAACAAIVAAAQPQWGTRIAQAPRTGSDLVVVLDVSRSMNARDVAPDRLTAAKETVRGITSRLAADRMGLVVFAGSARVRFPLTTDAAAAMKVVDSIETGTVFVQGGTDASLGIEEAVALLSDDIQPGRVILLLTDGDDLGGNPANAARLVSEAGITLLVAGVGTAAGAEIPVRNLQTGQEAPLTESDGTPVITALDEGFLRTLAAAAGGQYLGSDLSVVPGIVEGRMRSLERSQFEERATILPVERHHLFSAAALGLLVLAALAERFLRFGWRRGVALAAAAVLLAGCATDVYETNEEARRALESGDTARAITLFREVQVHRPDDAEVAINLAAAYHAAGLYDEAIFSARRALESNNPDIRGRAFSSIGHHQFALERPIDALSAFRAALLERPHDDDARHNYEVVLRLLFPEQEIDPGRPPDPGTTPSDPANGEPTPGEGTPSPGDEPGGTPGPGDPEGTPQPGDPLTADEFDRRIREIDELVARMILEAGDTPSPAEAFDILELLAERSRLAALRNALGGRVDPGDR